VDGPLTAPVIDLGDLLLRPQREDDVPAIVAAIADPECLRWMRMSEPPDADLVRRNLHDAQREALAGRVVRWAIVDSAGDELLGVVNLFDIGIRSPSSAEVGYWVGRRARGREVATRATRAAVRHGFAERVDGGLGLERLQAMVGVDNAASRAVLRKVGFTETGVLRKFFRIEGVPMDFSLHDLLVEEFAL